MTPYTETLDKLAGATEAQVLAAFASWQAGRLTLTAFYAVVDAYLTAAGGRATALADTALAAFVTVATGKATPALGLMPPERNHRGELAAIVTGETVADLAGRVGRHARAATLATAQDAYAAGMTARGVPGWTRVLNSGACELCQDLAGDVLPGDAEMYHHKGCGCTQRPVLNPEGTSA